MKAGKRRRKERHKLDQMLRVLFKLSKRMTVQLINGLFGEAFTIHEVKAIHYGNPEFVDEDYAGYNRHIGDMFLHLDTTRGTYHYHIEFQTLNDRTMVIRMFRYGFAKAAELALNDVVWTMPGDDPSEPRTENNVQGPPLIAFPSQIVIFLEENESIGDELSMRLRLPDGTEMVYKIPVLRYWKLSPEELKERKLYALLPLQVFRSRKKMRQIDASKRNDDEKRQLITAEFASCAQQYSVLPVPKLWRTIRTNREGGHEDDQIFHRSGNTGARQERRQERRREER